MTRVNFELLDAVKWLKEQMNEKAVSAERQAQILKAIQTAAAIVVAGSAKEHWLSAASQVITDEIGRDYETIVNLIAFHVAEKIARGQEQEIPATGKTLVCHVAKEINPDYRVQVVSLSRDDTNETEDNETEDAGHESASESKPEPAYFADHSRHHGTHLKITQNAVNHLRDACMRANDFGDIAAQNRTLLSIVRMSITVFKARATGIDTGETYRCIKADVKKSAPAIDKSAPLLAAFAELYLKVSKRNKWPKRWSELSDNKRTILSFVLAFGDAGEIDYLLTLRDEVAYEVIHLLGNQCRTWLENKDRRSQLPSLNQAIERSRAINCAANRAIENAKQIQLFVESTECAIENAAQLQLFAGA